MSAGSLIDTRPYRRFACWCAHRALDHADCHAPELVDLLAVTEAWLNGQASEEALLAAGREALRHGDPRRRAPDPEALQSAEDQATFYARRAVAWAVAGLDDMTHLGLDAVSPQRAARFASHYAVEAYAAVVAGLPRRQPDGDAELRWARLMACARDEEQRHHRNEAARRGLRLDWDALNPVVPAALSPNGQPLQPSSRGAAA